MEAAKERLLGKLDVLEAPTTHRSSSRKTQFSTGTLGIFALVQICLIASYTIIFYHLNNNPPCQGGDHEDLISSPARDAIRYEMRYFEKLGHLTSPFAGPPRPAADEAWHNLLSGMNIRVPKEYVEKFNATSLSLADGGYAAQLGMYHELHCLKKVRHWIYKEHYFAELTVEELEEQKLHIVHCLEWLRIVSLCRGDTVLTTFGWDGDKLETEYPVPRQCVDSNHLLSWSQKNAVDLSDPNVLPRPENPSL
ncbi:hypothetical protein BJ875DRAFT_204094 [Amylocarpus encephaloides]|uniref:Uncharacterized protein n=1 Tax=Amylocarpus encephaloides TaxID=45428 RepID=A0A9P8C7X2_9HELO|nr:hypothetical protein BJ875DRAFT_204094 [Amylocarpus encephaloides]